MDYYITRDAVTLEALFSYEELTKGKDKKIFGEMGNHARGIIRKAEGFFTTVNLKYLSDNEEYFLPTKLKVKSLNFKNYSDLRHHIVPTPIGFKGDMLDFSEQLLDSAKKVSGIQENVIQPYLRWLASNINDPQNLISGRGGDVRNFKPLGVDDSVSKLSEFFSKGSEDGEKKISELFGNNKQIIEAVDNNFEIGGILKSINRKEILNKVNELVHYLDKLHEVIDEMDEKDISPEVLDCLSKMTKEVAKEVEFMGVVFYNYLAFNNSIKLTIDKATSIF